MSDQVSPTTASEMAASMFGSNAWLYEEKYQEYLANPASVDEQWRTLFSAVSGGHGALGSDSSRVSPRPSTNGNGANGYASSVPPAIERAIAPPPAAPLKPADANPVPAVPTEAADEPAPVALRGAAGRIVENMVTSLSVPTATSVHPLPAKVLEVNRRILNDHLGRVGARKVSYTHLIAYAVVRALRDVPAMNAAFVEDIDGNKTPGVLRHEHVTLGIAIDLERSSGGRALVVPGIKRADTLGFRDFVDAYEDLVTRARANKLAVEDFLGVTLSLTNPGTLGTTQSVPRLMAGQGAIIGIGALDYPVEYSATDPATIAALGIGKVVTLTSTYDHRIIQGAESGLFLKRVHELLIGADGFYEDVFTELGVTESPAQWGRDAAGGGLVRSSPDATLTAGDLAVRSLIDRYRLHGHRAAWTDPLSAAPPEPPEDLDPASVGLSVWDYDRSFRTGGFAGKDVQTLAEVLDRLRATYCGTVGIEYLHIQDLAERAWLEARLEVPQPQLDASERLHLLKSLDRAEAFERFLQNRYIGQRRFSLEGSEATIPFIDATLEAAATFGTTGAILAMAHRGRLNALANIIGKSYEAILGDFEGTLDPLTVEGAGDVKYHKGGSGIWVGRDGVSLPVAMPPNPSHLEAVNPVALGIVRAKQDATARPGEFPILPILVHGDASFAGQGVVAETLNLSLLEGYTVGGAIHLVINNQIGFTTPPPSARSTVYSTDVAKGIEAPIFHVNGDDPEAVVRIARLALEYRETFHKDVVVDLICYRLHGHNETDDPSYTQPLMYKTIAEHQSVHGRYAAQLVGRGDVTSEEVDRARAALNWELQRAIDAVRAHPHPSFAHLPERPAPVAERLSAATGLGRETLDALADRQHRWPEGHVVHPRLAAQLVQRAGQYESGEVDWGLGEALAYGSLLLEGVDVRLTGQDSRRGTFSHRHAVLVDYETGKDFTPLAELAQPLNGTPPLAPAETTGRFQVRDSLLSEYAALGFEYGYSVERPDALVLWEAQFGDFANGAQIVIDNFIVAAEEKWGQHSGLVMLLPHGYEGAGPEHSSARVERYLQLAVDGNMFVVQPTTAAQFFHMVRGHAHQQVRRPLVVIAPKSLLRARPARSRIEAFVSGSFAEVLDDPAAGVSLDRSSVGRLIVCSGKVSFEAMERRDLLGARDAVVRIEQLAPWPDAEMRAVLSGYPNAEELVFLQEEPQNMGPWTYVREHLEEIARDRFAFSVVSRRAAASPATGSHLIHDLEVEDLMDAAVGPKPTA